MAFCPHCGNDTFHRGNIYTPEHELWSVCYDDCDYCGYREDYDCPEEVDYGDDDEIESENQAKFDD